MADEKRYYWLRLYDDFFGSFRIKKLRKMAGGDTYVIIYLKMQLKAMKTDGVLQYRGLGTDFVDELAIDIDEQPDDVRVTLMYLLSCGLAETNDQQTFFFPFSVANTGSETSSAQRVRDFRARQKALQCNADVTPMKRIGNVEIDIDIRDRDKEIEKDTVSSKKSTLSDGDKKETASDEPVCRTKDVRRVVDAWNELGLQKVTKILPDSVRGNMLRKRIKDYGIEAVITAIGKISGSDFLTGNNDRGWTITFDWFIKPNNFPKVLEGNYDNHKAKSAAGPKVKAPVQDDTEKLFRMMTKQKERDEK